MFTEILRPNGSTGINAIRFEVGAAAPNHYLNVDEVIHDDAASMVWDNWGSGHFDLYTLTNPIKEGIIEKIVLYGWFMSNRASENWYVLHEPDFLMRIGGNNYKYNVCERIEGAQPANVWTEQTNENVYTPLTTNPATGVAWTKSDLISLQLGCGLMRPQLSSAGKEYCTQLWVVVHYTSVSPTVTTDPATAIAAVNATPNGTLDNDGGEACDCGFEWGETVAYGNTTPTQSRTTGQTFAQTISGLDPNKTYHFRAFATNEAGTSFGADRTFTTPVALPTTTTDIETGVTAVAADINGTLDNDGGEACDCGFEWGETIAYGNTTPTQSRTTGQTFQQAIAGLLPNRTYHFRAFATNSDGTAYNSDRTFTTLAALPTTTTDPATGDSTVNGTLDDDGGEACDCGFEYGLTAAYGNTTPTQSRTTGQTFEQTIGGLAQGTPYHFRAFATNSAGTSYGADRTFTTPGSIPMVTTDAETGRGRQRAVLNATLDDDGGEVCDCGFEWGLDTDYGITTSPKSRTTGETFDEIITGLFPDTEYHYRAFATNSDGTGYGADRTFTTKPGASRGYALAREEL